MKIAIIQTSLSTISNSRRLGDLSLTLLESAGVEVDMITADEVEKLPQCGSRSHEKADLGQLEARLSKADAFVWTIPIYCSTYSGVAKNFLDLFSSSFRGKWFASFYAGGSHRFFHACGDFPAAVAMESQGLGVPRYVYVTDADFSPDGELAEPCFDRVRSLLKCLTDCVQALPRLPEGRAV